MLRSMGFVVLGIIMCLQSVQGSGVLNGDVWEKRENEVRMLRALKSGPVPPSEPSGCTNVKGQPGPICPPFPRNVAGVRSSPPIGNAKADNEIHNQAERN
ncbi:hypothetical protein AMTRI_Chr03g54000 [Amborella trichopoda]|uniref:Uncharacterized protein n=1 Tax=Amborella trichopoda TaxID=13333 RepID=W1PMZ5_AMBTC|nr:hypothetical protein AMTR_s00440p00012040 [Amborella trichopoda]